MSAAILRRLSKHKSIKLFNSVIASNASSCRDKSNIIHSFLPTAEIPDVSLAEHVFENFGKFPHKVAVECVLTGKKFTYEQIRTKSRNLNKALRKKLKLGKGDVVAILLPNVPEYPIAVLGALQAALTATTINPLYTPDEIKRQLVDSGAKAVITLGPLWPLAQAAVKLIPSQMPILTVKMQEAEPVPPGAISFTEFTDSEVNIEDAPPTNQNDTVLLPYSSGTTGLPKGVELTNRNIVANLCQMSEPYFRLAQSTTETHQDVVPAVLPFFHIYGITSIMLTHLYHMCKLVSLPKFTPELYVTTLAKHKPHVLFIVPPIVLFMTGHPSVKKEYLQSIRALASGAAPLGALDEERFLKKAEKPIDVVQGYGLTEASPCVILTSPIRKKELGVVGSTGEVIPNTEVKIVPADNPAGEALGPNQPGELLIKGPQVMKGYHNRPEETEEAFQDGWLRTGDMMHYDDNKMFYVTDRLKELIKVKGFQVAPAELEEIIRSHADVADAAVIGIPHSSYGEAPKAYVVPKPNVKFNTAELEEYVADKVTSYKQLKGGIAVVDIIPRNASGKIMRRELKLQYEKENVR